MSTRPVGSAPAANVAGPPKQSPLPKEDQARLAEGARDQREAFQANQSKLQPQDQSKFKQVENKLKNYEAKFNAGTATEGDRQGYLQAQQESAGMLARASR
ncbi:MAG: hypothetical protein ACT4TC_18600 [Myxococcaceae bacterium]